MLTTILSIIGSPVVGGAFGFLGSWITKYEERKSLALTFEHQAKMADINAKNRINQITLEGQVEENKLDAEAFITSQRYGNQNTKIGWVDAIKGLMRPLITTYLLVVVTYLAYSLHGLVGGFEVLPITELVSLYKEIIVSVLALTNMSVAWWLGSRPSSSRNINRKDI